MAKTDINGYYYKLKILKENFLAITEHFKCFLKANITKLRKIISALKFLCKSKIANESLNSNLRILNECKNDQNSLNQAHGSNKKGWMLLNFTIAINGRYDSEQKSDCYKTYNE